MGEIENAEKVTIVWRQFYISITPTPKAQVDTGKRLLKKKQENKKLDLRLCILVSETTFV